MKCGLSLFAFPNSPHHKGIHETNWRRGMGFYCLCNVSLNKCPEWTINGGWWSHIYGVLDEALHEEDAWGFFDGGWEDGKGIV